MSPPQLLTVPTLRPSAASPLGQSTGMLSDVRPESSASNMVLPPCENQLPPCGNTMIAPGLNSSSPRKSVQFKKKNSGSTIEEELEANAMPEHFRPPIRTRNHRPTVPKIQGFNLTKKQQGTPAGAPPAKSPLSNPGLDTDRTCPQPHELPISPLDPPILNPMLAAAQQAAQMNNNFQHAVVPQQNTFLQKNAAKKTLPPPPALPASWAEASKGRPKNPPVEEASYNEDMDITRPDPALWHREKAKINPYNPSGSPMKKNVVAKLGRGGFVSPKKQKDMNKRETVVDPKDLPNPYVKKEFPILPDKWVRADIPTAKKRQKQREDEARKKKEAEEALIREEKVWTLCQIVFLIIHLH